MALKEQRTKEWFSVYASSGILAQAGHRLQGSCMDPSPVRGNHYLHTAAQIVPMLIQILAPLLSRDTA